MIRETTKAAQHNMCYFCSKKTHKHKAVLSVYWEYDKEIPVHFWSECVFWSFSSVTFLSFFYVPNILWKIAHEFFTLTLPQGGERRDKPLAVPLCPPSPWSPPIVPLPPSSPPMVPLVPWRPDRICLRHSDVYYSDPLQLVHTSFPLNLIGL